MTLFLSSDEVELIPAREGIKCACCRERIASYSMEPVGGGERVPFCGWCVLYGGSEWGEQNREELLWSGEFVKGVGLKSKSKNTIVPKLNEQHQLSPLDAERYLTGIIMTSRTLEKGPLGRFMRLVKSNFGDSDDGG